MWTAILMLLVAALGIALLVLVQRDRDDKKNS